ncbi:unnamed protein product, partial [Polarella glacialis]
AKAPMSSKLVLDYCRQLLSQKDKDALDNGDKHIAFWAAQKCLEHFRDKDKIRAASKAGSPKGCAASPLPTEAPPSPAPKSPAPKSRQQASGAARARPRPASRSTAIARGCKVSEQPESVIAVVEPPEDQDADPRSLAAFFEIYRTMVCRRPEDDSQGETDKEGAQAEVSQASQAATKSSMTNADSKRSLATWGEAKTVVPPLSPGLAAWQSPRNPWHWPRKGKLPPMEATVLALLQGSPPPTEVNHEEAIAAKRALNHPVIREPRRTPVRVKVPEARLGRELKR